MALSPVDNKFRWQKKGLNLSSKNRVFYNIIKLLSNKITFILTTHCHLFLK